MDALRELYSVFEDDDPFIPMTVAQRADMQKNGVRLQCYLVWS